MTALCVLITRLPHTREDIDRVFGAIEAGLENGCVEVFLLGDGVLCSKSGPVARPLEGILQGGAVVKASRADIVSRGISGKTLDGIEETDDLEGELVECTMERAGKVVTW